MEHLLDDLGGGLLFVHHAGDLPGQEVAGLFVAFHSGPVQGAAAQLLQLLVGDLAVLGLLVLFGELVLDLPHRMAQPLAGDHGGDIVGL